MKKSAIIKGMVLIVFTFLIALFVYYRAGKIPAYKPEEKKIDIMGSSKYG